MNIEEIWKQGRPVTKFLLEKHRGNEMWMETKMTNLGFMARGYTLKNKSRKKHDDFIHFKGADKKYYYYHPENGRSGLALNQAKSRQAMNDLLRSAELLNQLPVGS